MNNTKLMKNAKTNYTIISILRTIVLVSGILLALGILLIVFVGGNRIPFSFTDLSMGNITLHLSENALPEHTVSAAEILPSILPAAVILCVVYYGLTILQNILKPMKDGRPFDTSVADNFRRLANAVLIGGVASNIIQIATGYFFHERYDMLKSLFREGVVDYITVTYSFSLTFIWIALFLYLLSYIFRYGEELQRQSDETL